MNNCIFDELDVEKSTNKQHVDYIYKILKNHESRLQGIEQKTENCLNTLYNMIEHFDQIKGELLRIKDIIMYMPNPPIFQLDPDKYETET